MKRSVQEIVELLVFGLIALLIGTGLLWLTGWIFDLVGGVFRFFAGLIWALLKFIVPVALVGAIAYLLVKLLQQSRRDSPSKAGPAPVASDTAAAPPPVAPATAAGGSAEVVGPSEPIDAEPASAPRGDAIDDRFGDEGADSGEAWTAPQPAPPAGDEAAWPGSGVDSSESTWTAGGPVLEDEPAQGPVIEDDPVGGPVLEDESDDGRERG